MKKQIIFLVALNFVCTFSVNAGPGGTGGIGTVPTLRMNGEIMLKKDEISALTTRNGDYALLEDLEEGFVHFRGVRFVNHFIEVSSKHEISTVILDSGEEVEISRRGLSGDMGGGGSTAR